MPRKVAGGHGQEEVIHAEDKGVLRLRWDLGLGFA